MAYSGAFLAILEILKRNDKPEGLSRNEIEEELLDGYNLSFDRRTFAKAIDEINATDEYRVISTKGKYSRYKLEVKNTLTSEELQLICALLSDTEVLSRLETKNIMEKLCVTFKASFDAENKIAEIIKSAADNKNEINGLDKLCLINKAINNGCVIKFKVYNNGKFTNYIQDLPMGWYVENGDIILNCEDNKYNLSKVYNLDIV